VEQGALSEHFATVLTLKNPLAQSCPVFPMPSGQPSGVRTVSLCFIYVLKNIFCRLLADEFDTYIILSFVNGTLVLSIGETIEEAQDTGILSSALTLAVQQIGADALLQVHPHGIRHILADHRVNQWSAPQGKTIVTATTNKCQVVVALSSAELVYFELDLDGQLNEYQDRKAMGSTITALSIAEVPQGRQRTPYLVSHLFWNSIYAHALLGCRMRGPDRSNSVA
jgi:hypothetical protein